METPFKPYSDYLHEIFNNEFYMEGRSPAQLFEQNTSSFSMEWWDRWFRWAFVTYYHDDDFNDDGDRGSLLYGLERVEREGSFPEWRRRDIFEAFKKKLQLKSYDEVEYVEQNPIKSRIASGRYYPYRVVQNGSDQIIVYSYAMQDLEPALSDACCFPSYGRDRLTGESFIGFEIIHREKQCEKFDDHEGEWLNIPDEIEE